MNALPLFLAVAAVAFACARCIGTGGVKNSRLKANGNLTDALDGPGFAE